MKCCSISEQESEIHNRIALTEKCWLTGFHSDLAAVRSHFPIISERPRFRVEPAKSDNPITESATGLLDPAKSRFDAHSAAQRFTPTHF